MSNNFKLFLVLFLSISIFSLTILFISGYLSVETGIADVILSALASLGVIKLNELEREAKRKQCIE